MIPIQASDDAAKPWQPQLMAGIQLHIAIIINIIGSVGWRHAEKDCLNSYEQHLVPE